MRKTLLLAAVTLCAPVAAHAQDLELMPRHRISVSPWVGYRVGFTQTGQVSTTTNDTTRLSAFENEPAGGLAVGADIDWRVRGPWSVMAGFMTTQGVDATSTVVSDGTEEVVASHVNSMWAVKAGVALQLKEQQPDFRIHRPTASIFVMPALVYVDPDDAGLSGDLDDSYSQLALNFGFKGESPLFSPRVLFQLGMEDYFTFWNEDRPAERFVAGSDDATAKAEYDIDPSHLLILRVGLSFHFR
jgi:hypothetical protein